jgi:hypothetical protein
MAFDIALPGLPDAVWGLCDHLLVHRYAETKNDARPRRNDGTGASLGAAHHALSSNVSS